MSHSCDGEEEYAYLPAPESNLHSYLDEDRDDLHAMIEWAEYEGHKRHAREGEGAGFTQFGKLWVISLEGAQPIHHDRHMSDQEAGNDTWNIVCSGEGGQMLITEVAQDIFNHMEIKRGGYIYLNTLNRHLVSRQDPTERCVLLQMGGFGPDEAEAALEAIIQEWRHIKGIDKAA